jgi:hypothetical protein
MRGSSLLAVGLGLLSPAASLLVASDSPCGTLCGNVLSSTTNNDIVCHEDDYTSGSGIVFQQCLACEQTSDYRTSDNETDQQYYLCELSHFVAHAVDITDLGRRIQIISAMQSLTVCLEPPIIRMSSTRPA